MEVLRNLIAIVLAAVSVAAVPADQEQGRVDYRNEQGITPLMCAARDGERKDAKALLNQGADVNALDTYGWSALTYAAAKGDLDIVKALLAKGANINAGGKDNYTPLMAAVSYGNVKVVSALIEKGADVNLPNTGGATALSTAIGKHQNKIVEILKKAGAVEPRRTEHDDPALAKDGGANQADSRITRPIPTNNPQPRYTIEARDAGIQGDVRARVLVGSDGRVKLVRILTGLSHGLTYQAINAAYQMVFKPASKNGEPVAYWMPVIIEFKLK